MDQRHADLILGVFFCAFLVVSNASLAVLIASFPSLLTKREDVATINAARSLGPLLKTFVRALRDGKL